MSIHPTPAQVLADTPAPAKTWCVLRAAHWVGERTTFRQDTVETDEDYYAAVITSSSHQLPHPCILIFWKFLQNPLTSGNGTDHTSKLEGLNASAYSKKGFWSRWWAARMGGEGSALQGWSVYQLFPLRASMTLILTSHNTKGCCFLLSVVIREHHRLLLKKNKTCKRSGKLLIWMAGVQRRSFAALHGELQTTESLQVPFAPCGECAQIRLSPKAAGWNCLLWNLFIRGKNK